MYDHTDLPTSGGAQIRQTNGDDYKPHLATLAAFARQYPAMTPYVKALTHLGWVLPGGVNAPSESVAFLAANTVGLPPACWSLGEPAAPQISGNMRVLAAAGAPVAALDGLWAAYRKEENNA